MTKLLTCILTFASLAMADIPETWRDNPKFKTIYRVTDAISAHPELAKTLKSGESVVVSQRQFSDLLLRDRRFLSLLIVGKSNQEDPGLYDAQIPVKEFNKLLTPTEDRAPLTHWAKHYMKSGDAEIPNIKPNFRYHHTFPVNVYPAIDYGKKDRPRLVSAGTVFRFVTPSRNCKQEELTIRIDEDSRYYSDRRKTNPEFVFASALMKTDFCLSFDDFVSEGMSQTGDAVKAAPDMLKWDDVAERYQSKFWEDTGKKVEVVRVSPFSKADEKSGRSGPSIRVRRVGRTATAEYAGPLYYECAGGVCRAQGYRITLNADGVVSMTRNRLYYWDGRQELLLDDRDVERLLAIVNDADQLRRVYEWAAGNRRESYSAAMSRLSNMDRGRSAGNTFGTFVIHVAKIRESLGMDRFPYYAGPAPGGE